MIILNFSHPLTQENLKQIEGLTKDSVSQVFNIHTQLDPAQAFAPQVRALISDARIDPVLLQTTPIVVNLPSLASIAALVMAELHGRMGYFPAVLRLRLVEGAVPPRFEVAELVDLQAARDAARTLRREG